MLRGCVLVLAWLVLSGHAMEPSLDQTGGAECTRLAFLKNQIQYLRLSPTEMQYASLLVGDDVPNNANACPYLRWATTDNDRPTDCNNHVCCKARINWNLKNQLPRHRENEAHTEAQLLTAAVAMVSSYTQRNHRCPDNIYLYSYNAPCYRANDPSCSSLISTFTVPACPNTRLKIGYTCNTYGSIQHRLNPLDSRSLYYIANANDRCHLPPWASESPTPVLYHGAISTSRCNQVFHPNPPATTNQPANSNRNRGKA